MANNKPNLELKVGIFAFIGLIILVLAVFSVSEIFFFRPGYFIKVYLSFASGINVAASVRVAGIEAGRVKDISFIYDSNETKANIALLVWLNKGVKIPQDSVAYVNMFGLIGETYLEIVPGRDYTHLLKDGDIIIGSDPVSTQTLMEVVHRAAANFESVTKSVNDVLDVETKEALKEMIHNFRQFSQSLKVISERLERGEGKLGQWLKPRETKKPEKK